MMYGDGVGMTGAVLWWILIVVGIVLLAILLVRATQRSRNGSNGVDQAAPHGRTARQILDERYARGDITTDEYKERLRALTDDN